MVLRIASIFFEFAEGPDSHDDDTSEGNRLHAGVGLISDTSEVNVVSSVAEVAGKAQFIPILICS